MRAPLQIITLTLALLLASGCSSGFNEKISTSAPKAAARATLRMDAGYSAGILPDTESSEQARARGRALSQRKVIRSADVTLGVSDVDESGAAIVAIAEGSGGFVLSSSRTRYSIKVPSVGFEDVLVKLGDLGEVKSKSLSGQDVTAEYHDLEIRLKNAHDARDAYAALLRKTNSVEEILKVEQAMRETQERIELMEGRRQFLDEHLALSAIDIYLHETRTRGPLMLLWDGVTWLFGKLLWL